MPDSDKFKKEAPDLNGIEHIIFDFGNILIDLDIPKTWQMMSSLAGDEYEMILAAWNKAGIFERFETGHMTEDQFLHSLQTALPENVTLDAIKQAWNAMLLEIPVQRFEMLLRLRQQYKVFLLSNTNAMHIEYVYEYLLKKYGMTDFDTRYFDRTFYSHLVGLRKPGIEIYEYVLNETKIEPSKTLFIDDLAENLVAPARLGIQTWRHEPGREISEVLK